MAFPARALALGLQPTPWLGWGSRVISAAADWALVQETCAREQASFAVGQGWMPSMGT